MFIGGSLSLAVFISFGGSVYLVFPPPLAAFLSRGFFPWWIFPPVSLVSKLYFADAWVRTMGWIDGLSVALGSRIGADAILASGR